MDHLPDFNCIEPCPLFNSIKVFKMACLFLAEFLTEGLGVARVCFDSRSDHLAFHKIGRYLEKELSGQGNLEVKETIRTRNNNSTCTLKYIPHLSHMKLSRLVWVLICTSKLSSILQVFSHCLHLWKSSLCFSVLVSNNFYLQQSICIFKTIKTALCMFFFVFSQIFMATKMFTTYLTWITLVVGMKFQMLL